MSKVSISEAARLVGLSRQHLYKRFITPGVLTVEKDGEKPPTIDTSELLRVFGTLKGTKLESGRADDAVLLAEIEGLRAQLADRDARIREALVREEWLRHHVSQVTGSLQLVGSKDAAVAPDLSARLDKAREVIRKYKQLLVDTQEALAVERQKGFWAKLFSSGEKA